jgi:uncharacterized protein
MHKMESFTIAQNILPAMLTSKYLELIVLPTEQCNFRCTYCYEDFSIGKMQPDIVSGLKQLITRRAPALERLKIAWFGGEPLAAKDIVYTISEHAHTLAGEFNIDYTGSMTTNGFLLTLNTAKKLLAVGVTEFQISLDGAQEEHDKTRRRIDGSGSFEHIWRNLIALKLSDLDFKVLIRVHITPENYESLFHLVEKLKTIFGGDKRFSVFFKAIADLGGPQSRTFKVLTHQSRGQAVEQLIQSAGDALNVVTTKNTEIPYVCYASHANAFVIRANGTLGKCTVALASPKNSIGQLMPDGTLLIDQQKLQPWLRGIQSQSTQELKCPLNGLK